MSVRTDSSFARNVSPVVPPPSTISGDQSSRVVIVAWTLASSRCWISGQKTVFACWVSSSGISVRSGHHRAADDWLLLAWIWSFSGSQTQSRSSAPLSRKVNWPSSQNGMGCPVTFAWSMAICPLSLAVPTPLAVNSQESSIGWMVAPLLHPPMKGKACQRSLCAASIVAGSIMTPIASLGKDRCCRYSRPVSPAVTSNGPPARDQRGEEITSGLSVRAADVAPLPFRAVNTSSFGARLSR